MPSMRHDAYGLPVSTDATATVEAYDRAVDALLSWDAQALERFRAAIALDPGLAVAHAGAAVCLFLEERFAEAQQVAKAARAAAASQTDRERRHVEGLALLVEGKAADAASAMREHLVDYPRDLVVFQRLYFVWFWQGKFPEMLALADTLTRYHPGNSFMLGLHAFVLEQAGRCDEAVRMAHVANLKNPRDAWAIHALAHALYEMAAFDTGVTRLPPAIEPCTHLGWFRNHLLWHLTLMHLARGEYDVASELGRTIFEHAPSSIPGDLHDSISLLWRLELFGRDVRERWKPFARIAAERLDRQALLFHAAHLAMALAASGDWTTAERQLGMLRERSARDRSGLVGGVLVPLIEGLHAFAAKDYRRTIERIEPLTPRVVELGGSRAQRDVFHDTLLEACFRARDMDRAERLLADRVARRPDRFWKTRTATSVTTALS
jgi:tetratricopeptide (TPR) repeat protein